MGVWSTITEKIKGIVNKMIGKQDIEEVLRVRPVISGEMVNAIELWSAMYESGGVSLMAWYRSLWIGTILSAFLVFVGH